MKGDSKLLLFGGENVGKTSILKAAYKILYQKNFLPVYIDGHDIKNSSLEEFKKLVRKAFIQQYGNDAIDDFDQLDINTLYILIDDIDKNPLKNQKAKGRFIKALTGHYKNIIMVGNELYAIEEIVSDEVTKGDLYSGFNQYEIMEFNHSLRDVILL